MIPTLRQTYNQNFSEEKYLSFLQDLNAKYQEKITFRVAETPIFIPKLLKNRLIEACEGIIDFIVRPDFKALSQNAIPPQQFVPNEDNHTTFLAIDFAICRDENNDLIPQLIEMQGFPSLYGFQDLVSQTFRQHFDLPDSINHLFNLDSENYYKILQKVILNGHSPENVILLEIEPFKQKTLIDFLCTQAIVGIKPVCISELILEGTKLFYELNGKKTPIHRIYNRVIFDELEKRIDLKRQFNLTEEVDVEWAGHPNWFFRISKYTVPFIQSPYIPQTRFLNQITEIPNDLENYVLKPLFSFAGAGVKFDVKPADIQQIPDNEQVNWILQKKVQYTDAIHDHLGEAIKAEVRMLFVWEKDASRPQLVTGLGRLSKGKMIGVDFNKDKTWVGGTAVFFEKD